MTDAVGGLRLQHHVIEPSQGVDLQSLPPLNGQSWILRIERLDPRLRWLNRLILHFTLCR